MKFEDLTHENFKLRINKDELRLFYRKCQLCGQRYAVIIQKYIGPYWSGNCFLVGGYVGSNPNTRLVCDVCLNIEGITSQVANMEGRVQRATRKLETMRDLISEFLTNNYKDDKNG